MNKSDPATKWSGSLTHHIYSRNHQGHSGCVIVPHLSDSHMWFCVPWSILSLIENSCSRSSSWTTCSLIFYQQKYLDISVTYAVISLHLLYFRSMISKTLFSLIESVHYSKKFHSFVLDCFLFQFDILLHLSNIIIFSS